MGDVVFPTEVRQSLLDQNQRLGDSFENNHTASRSREGNERNENGGRDEEEEKDDDNMILLRFSFTRFAQITCGLVSCGLVICLVTSLVFFFDDVNKTFCSTRNIIPSISSITGMAPQSYIWRTAVALHSVPRFAIGVVYLRFYNQRHYDVVALRRRLCGKLREIVFWLYNIENACLVGVTYIPSSENYYIHEKLFIVFIAASISYQFLTIVLFRYVHPDMSSDSQTKRSYDLKRFSFIFILLFTTGLMYFFYQHRWYCTPGAFTKFSLCEYFIVALNVLYHYTAAYDFRDQTWQVAFKKKLR